MAISLKHLFQSAKTDGPDNTIVQPSDWNDEHVLTLDQGKIVGRAAGAGTGAAQELPVSVATDGSTIISGSSSNAMLRITQTGAGNALVVEDSANPDATPFVVDANGSVGVGTTSTASAALNYQGSFNATTTNSLPSLLGRGAYGGGIGFLDGTATAGIFTQTTGTQLVFFVGQTSSDTAAGKAVSVLDATGMTLGSNKVDAFPSGTKLLFQQTAAPTGWTKITTTDNAALRIVSGTVGSGGSVNFTTAFASQTPSGSISVSGGSVSATTLTSSQIPSHTHGFSGTSGGMNSNNPHGHNLSSNGQANLVTSFSGGATNTNGAQTAANTNGTQVYLAGVTNTSDINHTHNYSGTTDNGTGGNGSHTHGFTNPTATFSGNAINLAVKYIDAIIASKD